MKRYDLMSRDELVRELTGRDEQLAELSRRNEERYRTLFMSMSEGFFLSQAVYDDQGVLCDYRFLDVNPALERMLGVDRYFLLGRGLKELFPEFSQLWLEVFAQVAGSGIPNRYCQHSPHFGCSFDIFAFRPAHGQVAVLVTDISERKRAEEALRESERRYREIVENQSEYVDRYLPGGILTFVNNALAGLTGLSPEQLLGKSFYPLLPEDDRERVIRTIESLSAEHPTAEIENRVELPGGTRWLHWRHCALTDGAGNIVEYQATGRDVTELRRAQEELLKNQHDLKLANELLEQRVLERTADLEAAIRAQESFSYSVSHDLRAPLRHINSFSAMIMEEHAETLPAPVRDYLQRICDASSRMGALIDNLLELSRVTRAAIDPGIVDLSELADLTLRMFRETEPHRRVDVVIEQGIEVMGDNTLLRQLLENLLGNAWKYTSRKPCARVEFGKALVAGQEAYFVKDNGAGFDMTYREKLFNAFERLHGAEFEGIGIGLATAQRIIQRHGGRIWGEGELDRGATFYFTLPVYF